MATQKSIEQERNLQLEVLDSQYQVFVPDQLLTHEHLNEITKFFETQSRLTRTALIGVGVVCGLRTRFADNKISVSKGIAVTTDGDLLYMEDTDFRYFKEYDNKEAHYEPFFPANEEKQIPLFELVQLDPIGQLPLDSHELAEFGLFSKFQVNEMYVLLYAEYYLKEPTLCTSIDCDNLGKTQVNKLKVLLISRDDMEKVIAHEAKKTEDLKHEIADDLYNNYFRASDTLYHLKKIKPRRVIINQFAVQSFKNLKNSYFNSVKKDISRVVDHIQRLLDPFTFLLDKTYAKKLDEFANNVLQETIKINDKFYAQYLYDLYIDLVTVYNELHDVLFNLVIECGPGIYNFPKHIMLGQIGASIEGEPVPFRHIFYPSPLNTKNKESLVMARSMIVRLNRMMRLFFVPETGKIHGIHVTPSMDADRKLEDRAIPFYYDYNPKIQLHSHWNYKKTRQGQEDSILSYYGDLYGGDYDETKNPLDYSIDPYNFFRIEGHLGKEFKYVLKELKGIRESKNLPFDIVAIRLGTPKLTDINLDDYRCEFEDINTMLRVWKKEQNCLYNNVSAFFSGFSTKPAETKTHKSLELANNYDNFIYRRKTDLFKEAALEEKKVTVSKSSKSLIDLPISEALIGNLTLGNYLNLLHIPVVYARAQDVINQAHIEIPRIPFLIALEDDEKEITFETPVAVIAYISELSSYIPSNFSGVNPGNVILFKDRMIEFCKFLHTSRTRTESIFAKKSYKKKGFEQQYLHLLGLLSANCCAGEKLEMIYKEIEKRKKNILQNLTLSKYLENHPGLEHKAGVHRGGTFVIVYGSNAKRNYVNPLSKQLEAPARALVDKEMLGDTLVVYFRDNMKEFDRLKKKDPVLYKEISDQLETTKEDSIADMVIADFCLPYICCSKCPPVAYIFEKSQEPTPEPTPTPEPVSLIPEMPEVCSSVDEVKLEVTPVSGVVSTKDPKLSLTVKKSQAGTYVFIPKNVPVWQFYQPIAFTVNGLDTLGKITVYEEPVVVIEHEITDSGTRLKPNVKVTFIAKTGQDDTTFKYNWEFSDAPAAAGKQVVIQPADKNLKQLTAKLIVINGPCRKEITKDVYFIAEEQVSLKLPKDKACSKEGQIPFSEISPKGGEIKSAEANEAIQKEPVPAFDPSKVSDEQMGKTVTFTVNDKETSCVITVYRSPEPDFSITNTEYTDDLILVTLINRTVVKKEEDISFNWVITSPDGSYNQSFTENKLKQGFIVEIPKNKIEELGLDYLIVSLFAANNICEVKHSEGISLDLLPSMTCRENMKAILKAQHDSLLTDEDLIRQTQSELLRNINSDVTNLYLKVIKQIKPDKDYIPSENTILEIRSLLENLQKVNVNTPAEREYTALLWIVLVILMFNILRCSDCKVLEEITGLLPDPDNTFGKEIFSLADKYRPGINDREKLNNFIQDYLVNRLCKFPNEFLSQLYEMLNKK